MRLLTVVFIAFFHCNAFSAQQAPNFSFDGRNLSDLKGKVVYLDFWASWCGPCAKSFPWMNEMHAKYAEQGLVILAVNVDSEKSDALEFLKKRPAQFAITYDPNGEIAKTYKIPGMPSSFIIGRDGQLITAHQGFHTSKTAIYEAQIQALIAD